MNIKQIKKKKKYFLKSIFFFCLFEKTTHGNLFLQKNLQRKKYSSLKK
jgi:hypothetical protein